jgi:uncharacterized protein (DUF2237 family)
MKKIIEKNILGQELKVCCKSPITGFLRDGFCRTCSADHGTHVVCAMIAEKFLEFTKFCGNDLSTPNDLYGFPGLKQGDRWCLCASRWKEAWEASVAPLVDVEATHKKALQIIGKDLLLQYRIN